jgi:hypothetical protein
MQTLINPGMHSRKTMAKGNLSDGSNLRPEETDFVECRTTI